MTNVPPSLSDFARRLLDHEARGGQGTQDLADAMERCCEGLHPRLAPLVSSAGFNALFGRAVTLASRNFSFLSVVTPMTMPICSLDGLRHVVEGRAPVEVGDALVAILANFISLLIIFLGENLGLRKVREVWPDVPFVSAAPSENAPQ